MTPDDRPANENDERPPLWPGMSRRTEERIELWVSLVVIAIGGSLIVAFTTSTEWRTIATSLGIAIVGMLIAGLWRLIVHGRA